MSVNDFDQELHDEIEELVGTSQLDRESAAYGIAQQVIQDGYGSLTEKQREVYDSVIVPALEALREERERNRILLSNPE